MSMLYKGSIQKNENVRPLTEDQRELAEKNYPLVHHYAIRRMETEPVLTYEEYVEHGHTVLIKCVRSFDPARGRLSTLFYKAMNRHMAYVRRERCWDNTKYRTLTDMASPSYAGPEKDDGRRKSGDRIDSLSADTDFPVEDGEFFEYALRLVSPRQRLLLRLMMQEGYSQIQAGRTLGLTKSRVNQIYSRAIATLRERLASTLDLPEQCHAKPRAKTGSSPEEALSTEDYDREGIRTRLAEIA